MPLTVEDVSHWFGVSEDQVYVWLRAGTIPAYRHHETFHFDQTELLEWATARGLTPAAGFGARAAGLECQLLAPALAAGGTHAAVPGADRESIIAAVVDRLPLPEGTDRAFLAQALLAREALGSTAVGDGIAIPHVRAPIVLALDCPAIALCQLAHPVELKAPDGRPVDLLFVILSPTVRAHLHLLARLAAALKDAKVRDALRERTNLAALAAALAEAEARLAPDALPANPQP